MLSVKRTALCLGLLLASAACVAPVNAQMPNQALPGSYTAAMISGFAYTPAAPLFPVAEYTVNVSYYVDQIGSTYTYFYKIEHLGGQAVRAASVNVAPNVVNFDAGLGLYKFGAIKPTGPSSILVADNILGPNTKPLRWSSAIPGVNLKNDTIYLWIESNYPATMVNLGILDGIAANTMLPAPAPEPISMTLAGLGLGAVAAIRKKKA